MGAPACSTGKSCNADKACATSATFSRTRSRTALRRAHERELIRTYLAALAELGVHAPGFDFAWRQYRLHALYAWIAAAVTAAAATFQSEPIVRAGLTRTSTAVVDLESLEALDELRRR
jgi:hypothetical protein